MAEHSFNTELAKEYGIECAIIIKNLDFWLSKNKANNRNIYDNKVWTYMSMSGFSEYFGYLSDNQVRYTLKKLEEKNVIESGVFNKKGYDRTKWYTFTTSFINSHKSILQFSQLHLGKLPDAFEKITEPIPDTNTNIKKDTNINILSEFEKWYEVYPRHEARKKAETAYINLYKKKLLPDLATHVTILKAWKESGRWNDKKYIPLPASWLNAERWNDDLPEREKTALDYLEEIKRDRGEI